MRYCLPFLLLASLLAPVPRPAWSGFCAGVLRPAPPASGLRLPGSRIPALRPAAPQLAVTGTVHALAVYARFKDEDRGNRAAPGFAADFFDPQLPGSLTHFYHEMSRGQFLLTGEALPQWYTSSLPGSAYAATSEEDRGDFGSFVLEILAAVDADTDLGQYDNDGPDNRPNSGDDDGHVDFLFVNTLTAPPGFILRLATGVGQLGLYNDFVSADPAANGGFIRVRSDGDSRGPGGVLQRGHTFEIAVGSMAHEFGHVLGLPDLYDRSYSGPWEASGDPPDDSAGIGTWGLMAHGAQGWHEVDGPTPFCAWSLEQLGWLGMGNQNLVVVAEDLADVVLDDVSAGGQVYKLPVRNTPQYLLVEHRRAGNSHYERHLPAGGLLIWRIDPDQHDNNKETNKLVDLECADGGYRDAGHPLGQEPDPDAGRDNLDYWAHDAEYRDAHRGNLGDATDVWDGEAYTEYSVVTNPAAPPGVSVCRIRRDGDRMVADLRVRDNRWAGPVGVSEFWEGTIEMVGDVVIRPDTRLTIRRGTEVRVGPDQRRAGQDPERCELVVQGELSAGSAGKGSVVLTSAAAVPRPGDWYGIVVGRFGVVNLRGVELEYVRHGLWARDLAQTQSLESVTVRQASGNGISLAGLAMPVTLAQVRVSGADGVGVVLAGSGPVTVVEGLFADNGLGGLERTGGRLRCVDSEFVDNGLDSDQGANLILGVGAEGEVKRNQFRGGVGIRCVRSGAVEIEGNTLVDHRIGLVSVGARPRISSNEFAGNELAMQILGLVVPGRLVLNIVEGATRLVESQAPMPAIARNNWWGRADEEWIETRMSDGVAWRPFLNFDPRLPITFGLSQNFPNPFNGSTVIDYSVGLATPVVDGEAETVLEVRSMTGALVRRLAQGLASPGFYTAVWDGRNEHGRPVASGVYCCVLRVGPIADFKRLVVLK